MSNSRLEKFIYAICGMEVDDLPTPLSRIETLWNCLITGEVPDFEPLSRNEKYLMAMLTGDVDGLPEPTSRGEKLLYKIATGETDLSDVPGYLSRYEELLKQLIENGGIGGTDFEYVLYTLNQPLSTLYSTAEDIVNTATIYGDTVVNTLQEPSDLAVTPIGENIDISNTTVDGTVEGKVKSAILKGNTLVNIPTTYNRNPSSNGNIMVETTNLSMLKSNTKYLLKIINKSNYDITYYPNASSFIGNDFTVNGKSEGYVILTSLDTTLTHNGIVRLRSSSETIIDLECAILFIEYKDGMENWDIPYFEGMQSVKMPVLTTTGKNLFDVNKGKEFVYNRVPFTKFDGSVYTIHVGSVDSVEIENDSIILNNITYANTVQLQTKHYVDEGVTYNISIINESGTSIKVRGITYYNQYGEILGGYWDRIGEITPPKGCNYLIVGYTCELGNGRYKIQFEQGTTSTTYEPYKSNILSCNEEVTLRGIGNVRDTLDGNTGELTQRIGEVVLDGSENWVKYGVYGYRFLSHSPKTVNKQSQLNNINTSIKDVSYKYWMDNLKTHADDVICSSDSIIGVTLGSTKIDDVTSFKQWLSENPIRFLYILQENNVKTVDLSITDQDGNETSHLHTFNDTTHISTSAECLLPNVVIPADISYPSIIKANTLYTVKLKRPVTNGNLSINLGGTEQLVTSNCFTIQTPATLTSQNVIFSGKGNVISEVTVVEGDHTEKEYGYFEGMMSVRMPVLTTTGKNLFDIKNMKFENSYVNNIEVHNNSFSLDVSIASWRYHDYNGLDDTKTYTLSLKKTTSQTDNDAKYIRIRGIKKDGTKDLLTNGVLTTITFTGYVGFSFGVVSNATNTINSVNIYDIQLEQDTQVTSYEPYKSNILTTTSKNLFDMNRPYDVITDSQATVVQDTDQITVSSAESGTYVNANFILDKDFFAGKTVTGSCLYESDEKDIGTVQITYQDGDGEYHYQWIRTPTTFTFPNSFIGDVMLSISANNTGTPQSNTVTVKNIQLELGSTATPYEPYSEVVLRGIGDVKDELNCLTGEVTENFEPFVFNGSENWILNDDTLENTTRFILKSYAPNRVTNQNVGICNNFAWGNYDKDFPGIMVTKPSGHVYLRTPKMSVDELKTTLSNNAIHGYYNKEKSIKTVDLSITDQDGQPTKLSTFNDVTHVSIEAEDLLPTVDLEVPTKIEETLSTIPTLMNDISETQQLLNESIDDQAENINEVSTAITEIHNDIL